MERFWLRNIWARYARTNKRDGGRGETGSSLLTAEDVVVAPPAWQHHFP
jgi:hypothetical protein